MEPVVQPVITFLHIMCKKRPLSLYLIRRFFVFRNKNKIIAWMMVILLVIVFIVSVSFSTRVSKISSSFACTTTVEIKSSKTRVVEAVADISVMSLTADLVGSIEDNLEELTVEIYKVRQAEEKAAAKAKEEAAKSEATNNVASGANLNGLEAEILRLINKTRADHGLSQLSVVQSLTDIARTRCSDMVGRGYFSHYNPEGATFFNIMLDSGISWTNAGENLGNAKPASYGSPSAFLKAWMASASHRDNMLRSNYRLIGVGVVDGGGRRVVTTVFLN